MKKINLLVFSVFFTVSLFAQPRPNVIRQMKWGLESSISLTLANDSVYVINVNDVYKTDQDENSTEATYFHVSLSREYIEQFKNNSGGKDGDENLDNLYRAIHSVTGGSFAHFLNCLMYALETQQLDLTAPQMMRPVTKWKPNPPTESYLRTKDWKYYVPVENKNLKKEYNYREERKLSAELDVIPMAYIRSSLNTSDKQYQKLKSQGFNDQIAEIDIVKIMLGSNFLGKEQIKYIRNAVLQSVSDYVMYELPSIIIFNNYKAAVAMNLDVTGYKIEGMVFSDEQQIDQAEKDKRAAAINRIVDNINRANQKAIEKKLKMQYE